MYIISTATLVFIIALASSLAVVVQVAAEPKDHTAVPKCADARNALARTCHNWWLLSNLTISEADLVSVVTSYNKDVNVECTNLVKGDTVRVFLL